MLNNKNIIIIKNQNISIGEVNKLLIILNKHDIKINCDLENINNIWQSNFYFLISDNKIYKCHQNTIDNLISYFKDKDKKINYFENINNFFRFYKIKNIKNKI